MIINWWNLEKFDTQQIWMLEQDPRLYSGNHQEITPEEQRSCTDYRTFLERFSNTPQYKPLLEKFRGNTFKEGRWECKRNPSRFFYIPKEFAKNYAFLSYGANLNRLIQHNGPLNIIQSLVDPEQIVRIPEYYQPSGYWDQTSPQFWRDYRPSMTIAHSHRLYRKNQIAWEENLKMVREKYFRFSNRLIYC